MVITLLGNPSYNEKIFSFPVFNAHNNETLAAIHGGNE
jgi:hypothetical protein